MLESTVAGTPCQIRVDEFNTVSPWRGSIQDCPSSDDYYGYEEISFTIFDRKGYVAAWLENKMSSDDDERIRQEIRDYYSGEDF